MRDRPERQLGAAYPAGQSNDHWNRSSSGGRITSATGTFGRVPRQAAHDDDRLRLRRLALQQRRGGGDLVGEADDADLQGAAEQVGLAAQVDQRRDARREPIATPAVPRRQGRPKLSLMTTPTSRRSRASAARIASADPSGSTGSSKARWRPSAARDVGLIDAGVGHHEAQPVLHDHQVRPAAHDLDRFRQHDLDDARVLADLGRQRDRLARTA